MNGPFSVGLAACLRRLNNVVSAGLLWVLLRQAENSPVTLNKTFTHNSNSLHGLRGTLHSVYMHFRV